MSVKRRRGGAALEFALVLPTLVLLTLPVAEFTWYFLTMQDLQVAAQNGTRAGAKTRMSEDPVAVAVAASAASLYASQPVFASTASFQGSIVNDVVRVEISMPYHPIADFFEMPSNLAAFHQMRIEKP